MSSFPSRILETARLDPAEDLGGKAAAYRVRLDEVECPLDGHRGRTLVSEPTRRREVVAAAVAVRRVPSAGGAPAFGLCIGVSQYGQICQSGSSGALAVRTRLLELRRADGANEEARIDVGVAYRAADVGRREARLDRTDLELALAPVVENSGGRKSM